MDIIREEISSCEKEIEDENLNADDKCPAMNEENDDETDNDDTSVISQDVLGSTHSSAESSAAGSTSSAELSKSSSFNGETSCEKCGKNAADSGLKTKKAEKSGYKTSHYCSCSCFEGDNNFHKKEIIR